MAINLLDPEQNQQAAQPAAPAGPVNLLAGNQPATAAPPADTLAPSAIQAAEQTGADTSVGERFLIGTGRGFTRFGRGLKQLALQAGGALGFDTAGSLADLEQRESNEKQLFEAGLGKSTAAGIGEFVGEVAPTLAVPGAALGRGAGFAAKTVAGGLAGAAAGGIQYVDEDQTRLGNVGQGLGMGALAGLGSEVLVRGASKVANVVGGTLREGAQEGLDLGKKYGVDVLAPDVAGSPIQQKLGVISEQVPFVGIEKARLRQNEQARQAAQGLVARMVPEVEDVGQEIQDSLRRRTQNLRNVGGRKFEKLAADADPLGEIDLKKFADEAQGLIATERRKLEPDQAIIGRIQGILNRVNPDAAKALETTPGIADDTLQALKGLGDRPTKSALQQIAKLEAAKEAPNTALLARITDLTDSTRAGNFSEGRFFLSNLQDEIADLTDSLNFKEARPLRKLASSLKQDLNDFADAQGGDIAKQWKDANKFWIDRVTPQMENDIVKAARNLDPDTLFKTFVKSGLSDKTQRLYSAMDARGKSALKAGILQNALEAAQRDGRTGVVFSPARFAQQLERFSEATGVVFSKADKAELDGFTKLMRIVERSGQVAENPPTGNRLLLGTILGEILTGTGGAITSSGLPAAALANVMFTSRAGKRLLLASSKFPPGHPTLERAIDQFMKRLPVAAGGQADEG